MEVLVAQAQYRAMKPNRIGRNALMILGLVATSNPTFSRTAVTDLHLAVRLYDYVNLPGDEWSELAANAARVLRHANVEVNFVECYRGGIESSLPECKGFLRPGELMLRVFQAKSAANGRQPAFAAMTPEGGAIMTIYINPAERNVRSGVLSYGTLLGHAVAHEIGHLLLGVSSHSPGGIMRLVWRQSEEELMVKRGLLFDAGQASRIRAALIAKAGQ